VRLLKRKKKKSSNIVSTDRNQEEKRREEKEFKSTIKSSHFIHRFLIETVSVLNFFFCCCCCCCEVIISIIREELQQQSIYDVEGTFGESHDALQSQEHRGSRGCGALGAEQAAADPKIVSQLESKGISA